MTPSQAEPVAGEPIAPRRRSSMRPTVEGIAWLLLGLLLLYQGWLRAVNLVALLASFLIGLWILNLLWVFGRHRIKRLTARRVVKEAVFVGEPFVVEIEVHNPTRETQKGVRVTDTDSCAQHGWLIPELKAKETVRHFGSALVPRRGRHRWAALEVATGYPFGLFRRTLRLENADSVIVLPRLGCLHTGRLKRLLLQQPHATASTQRPVIRHPGAQTEFYGLREFRSGDSPRWIHWRTSARVGDLMVREFEEPPVDHLLVILDPWLPEPAATLERQLAQTMRTNRETIQTLLATGPAPPAAKRKAKEAALARKEAPFREPLATLELAISLSATICWEWCRQVGARIGLGVAGRTFALQVTETGQRQAFPLLEQLALVEGQPFDVHAESLLPLTQAALPPGPVVLITTRSSSLPDLISQAVRRPVLTLDFRQKSLADVFELEPRSQSSPNVAPASVTAGA